MRGTRQKSKLDKTPPPRPQIIPEGRQQKINYFLQKVEDKVIELIDTEAIKIAKQKIPFVQIRKDDPQVMVMKLKKIQIDRQTIQSKLQSITQEEYELKQKHRQLQKLNVYGLQTKHPITNREREGFYTIRPKSELSTEDITLLKKLKKEQREFERSLDEKTKAHIDAMERLKRKEFELEERRKRQEGQVKRREIGKRLEVLNKQKQSRQKQFQEEKRKIVELKTKKKLFQQFQRAQKQKQKNELEMKINEMESRLKEKEMDLQSIKKHEQKYRQIKQQQRINRQKRKQQFQQLLSQRKQQTSYEKSKYYTIVYEQTKKKKKEIIQKQKQMLEHRQAAKIYAQLIKKQHSPRVITKLSQEQSWQKKQEGLSFDQVKQIGNNYMQEMRKLIKKRQNVNPSQFSNQSQASTIPLKIDLQQSKIAIKNRDYLSQRRMFRPKKSDKMNQTEDKIKDRFIRRELQDVYKIINSKEDRVGKLERVKTIAEKLDIQKKGNDPYMIDKISAKLKILETLTESNNL